MKVILFISILFLNLPLSTWASGECKNLSSNAVSRLALQACEMEFKVLGCDEFSKDPLLAKHIKKCPERISPSVSIQKILSSCYGGGKEAWSDLVKFLIIDPIKFFSQSSKATNDFLLNCAQSLDCKIGLYQKTYQKLPSLRQIEKLKKMKTILDMDVLWRNAQSVQNSSWAQNDKFKRATELKAHFGSNDPWLKNPTLTQDKALWGMISEIVGKKYNQFKCVDEELASQMVCYSVFSIVDPTLAAGILVKAPKLVVLLEKLRPVSTLQAASTSSKIKSRLGLIAELESKKKNLFLKKKELQMEVEIPKPLKTSSMKSSLNALQDKIDKLEKLGSKASRAERQSLASLKVEQAVLEARFKFQNAVNKYHEDFDNLFLELEKITSASSFEEGAAANRKIQEVRKQLIPINDLEISMIKEENKLLKLNASELEIVNLNLYAEQKTLLVESSTLSGQKQVATFDFAQASREEYRASQLGKSTTESSAAKKKAHERLTQIEIEIKKNEEARRALSSKVSQAVDNDAAALERFRTILQGNAKPPPGVPFRGNIYRSGAPEIHPGNIAANHRYSEPNQGLLYTSESAGTVKAELVHYGVDPTKAAPIKSFPVKLKNVLDLTDPAARQALGLDLSSLIRNDYFVTHSMGDVARELGYQGIIAPSARDLTGAHILLFDEIKMSAK